MTGLMLAKAAGATTIVTSSSDEKLAMAREKYGLDHCINYKTTPNWAEKALEFTEGRGVDVIFENGGSGTIAQSLECIARGGQINVIGFLSPAKEMPDVASLVLARGCIVRGVVVGSKQLTEEMMAFVCRKNLQVPVEKTFGFSREEVLEAYRYLESGSHVGKVCIQVV
jgi:NADPH:quinone reductase-like Zn-dependent oxidoreductase